jgi:replicative DNA helicase
MQIENKKLPNNLEAERSLLGSILLDKDVIFDIVEFVSEEDFFVDSHKKIFKAINNLFSSNLAVDIVTVSDELNRMGVLDSVGGSTYLSEISDLGIITSHAKSHAKIISEKSMLRKLILASNEIIQKGYEFEKADSLLDYAEQSIFDISQRKNKDGLTPIKDVINTAYDEIDQAHSNGGKISGVASGFVDLDAKTNGFQKSDLILVAARPSMGKTAFSLNLCLHAALRENSSVAIFSLEMSKEQLVYRMLSSTSLLPIQDIRNGNLKEDQWVTLTKSVGPLAKAKIFIDDTPGITVLEMRAKARRLKMEHGLDFIMVDYLQLMSASGRAESRQQEISAISRGLKALAREMNCPVIALSQLSRAPEARADHRPILSDLRESGAIEQDADIVMFLYRDEYYHPDSEKKGIGEVIIAKQRNGETGTIELAWLGQYTKFANKARDYE